MKTAKESIYEYVHHVIYTNEDYNTGLETKIVADALGMQRSNVSALLNELVKDGLLTKTTTRPVYYQLQKEMSPHTDGSCFTKLIGHNGSLRNAIQLAKAAILYPKSSLHVLLSSQSGCGTTYFANLMYQYAKAKGVLQNDAPFVKINCKHYAKNVSAISDDLFGADDNVQESAFARAQHGMLFIDNFDLLDAKQQSRIMSFLETNALACEHRFEVVTFSNIVLVLTCSPQSMMQYNRRIPVTIELPKLHERPIKERFELINYFFSVEGSNSNRSIEVTRESIQALLLSDFAFNVKELELEIKAACAKAYIRVVDDYQQTIHVCLSDFNTTMKKSLLNLRDQAIEHEPILNMNESIYYDKDTGYVELMKHDEHAALYTEIKKQFDELSNRGIKHSSVKDVIDTHIQNLFKQYSCYNAYDNQNNLDQLSKIVDQKIIHLIQHWLHECKKNLSRNFTLDVFYGLCLHINAVMTSNSSHQRVDNNQIVNIIQDYPKEYAASVQLADTLKSQLELALPIEEIVLITMFLIEHDKKKEEHPVLLYIMHGNGTASSLCDVTNRLTHCHNAYSYDLCLETSAKQAMEELKTLILKIDCGAGVLVIYDMGSIKTMIDTIVEEIDIKIRYMNIPITLIGIDVARKCSMETDLDYVYHIANLEVNHMHRNDEKRNDILITLCHTGEGGAMQLKRYIDQYSKLGIKTIALAISTRSELLKEVMSLQKTFRIHAFVGTYDPRLLGIPFISIGRIFETTHDDLDRILMFEPTQSRFFDYREVYKYLEEQLKYVSIPKLKMVLPNIIDELCVMYSLSMDQQVGLFMHLACLVERLIDGVKIVKNSEKNKIISVFEEDYKAISKILVGLEKAFKILVDDNEIATIIMIIKKI